MSTKFPVCVVAMELSAQLEARGAELLLDWIPREVNAEADRLADGDSRGFDPELRVHADMRHIRWLVRGRLMKTGIAFHNDAKRHLMKRGRITTEKQATFFAKRRLALRGREPW